ncbi:MAG: hypothetical protein JWL71_1399, partial [Acidobacteria bacterium]|nr:hypothetical protein [Acidobacteriota bacterium]
MSRTIVAFLVTMLLAAGAAAQTTATPTFTFSRSDYASDAGARGLVVADFDNDGAPDFATVNSGSNTVDVFMNREFASGGFALTRYRVGAGPFDVTVSDFNFDSYPDLVVAAADADEIDVLFGAAGGAFRAAVRIPAPGNPRGVAAGYFGLTFGYSIVYSSYTAGTISFIDYDYSTATFTPGVTLNAGTNPQGIAVGSFKPSGGYPDIVVANAGGSQLTAFYNASGTFTRAELKAPAGQRGTHLNVIVAADFDKDGRTDLAAASTADNYVTLWMNSSSGLRWTANFTGAVSSPRGIAAADLTVDGRPEILVANRASNSITVFIANATAPIFTTHQIVTAGSGARGVGGADFDGDGRVDLATGGDSTRAGTVLWNRTANSRGGSGGTAFTLRALPDVTPDSWVQGGPYAVADFNHNGIPDIVVGDGVVLDASKAVKVDAGRQSPFVSSAVAADFNEDGHMDFAQTTYYYVSLDPWKTALTVDVMLGDGTGHFTLGTALPFTNPRGMVTGDFNRDGHADVIVIDETDSAISRKVFLGRGNGTFTETDQATAANDYLTGAGDVNGDGKLDLVVWNYSSRQIAVYLGDGKGGFPTERVAASAGGSLYGSHVVDLNGDGRADVVAARDGATLVAWLGNADGSFSLPLLSDLPAATYSLAVADLTGDGHVDVLTGEGTLAVGKGDGTFGANRDVNIAFANSVTADIDRDGLQDVVIGGYYYTAMALYNRRAEPPNAAPIARVWPHGITLPFVSQFGEEGPTIDGTKSYDPNLDLLAYSWRENGREIATGTTLFLNLAPGTHVVTLIVRDNAGAESHDTATITISPYQEIVFHPANMSATSGAWTWAEDATAADGAMVWHPNANAAKLASPLASPTNYFDVGFPADPTQEYKLWIRLKAQGNNAFNDSVFVQFEGAVDGGGSALYPIGTTSALAVNLE